MISVVMATYNGETFIEEQLLSLYNQTRQPDEVIFSDDGSTDKTVRIINEFIGRHKLNSWKVYFHTGNHPCDKGYIRATRNFVSVFEKASGDIVFFSDQDDLWDRRRIEVMAGTMEVNPEICALHCNKGYIDENGRTLQSDVFNGFPKGSLTKVSVLSNRFNPWLAWGLCMAVRKSVLDLFLQIMDSHPPLDYMFHDYGCAYIASAYDGYYFYNEDLVFHRRHSGNVSAANIAPHVRNSAERQDAFHIMIISLTFILKLLDFTPAERPFLPEKPFATKLKKICEQRLENHQRRKLFSTLSMFRYVPKYITVKGYLGDILYTLGLEKYFK